MIAKLLVLTTVCLYLDDVCEEVELEDAEDKLLLLADEEQSAGISEA